MFLYKRISVASNNRCGELIVEITTLFAGSYALMVKGEGVSLDKIINLIRRAFHRNTMGTFFVVN